MAGTWTKCDAVFVTEAEGGAPPVGPVLDPVEVPWQTGFENDFCEYAQAKGFCYTTGDARYTAVTAPVNAGQRAAAFTVDSSEDTAQTRCVREGTLPADAYYGAWFYLPLAAESAGNWNLMYFQGGDDATLHALWDVSIAVDDDGRHALYVRDQLRGDMLVPPSAPAVPIAEWFHVEFRLRRAADETGSVALYQDQVPILQLGNVSTDPYTWGQWYVGNYGTALVPSEATVYVDDVSIRRAP